MIFVTIGTHPGQFTRLLKRIDEIAPQVKDKIIIQRGFTKYRPKNCESFEFTDDMAKYFKKCRMVISHTAISPVEFVLNNKKPLITVPRQSKYGEHLNDHQVEFSLYLEKKIGSKAILEMNELTADLLNKYRTIPAGNRKELLKFQSYFINLFSKMNKDLKN